jgi:dCMP deaminase
MKRPSKDITNIDIASIVASRGKCGRAKVGCIITKDGRIVSSGYNGPIMAGITCDIIGCDMIGPCEHSIHAESNAIAFAARMGISLEGTKMYCTCGPCDLCAYLIVQAGIKEFIYRDNYRTQSGINTLLKHKVLVRQMLL